VCVFSCGQTTKRCRTTSQCWSCWNRSLSTKLDSPTLSAYPPKSDRCRSEAFVWLPGGEKSVSSAQLCILVEYFTEFDNVGHTLCFAKKIRLSSLEYCDSPSSSYEKENLLFEGVQRNFEQLYSSPSDREKQTNKKQYTINTKIVIWELIWNVYNYGHSMKDEIVLISWRFVECKWGFGSGD